MMAMSGALPARHYHSVTFNPGAAVLLRCHLGGQRWGQTSLLAAELLITARLCRRARGVSEYTAAAAAAAVTVLTAAAAAMRLRLLATAVAAARSSTCCLVALLYVSLDGAAGVKASLRNAHQASEGERRLRVVLCELLESLLALRPVANSRGWVVSARSGEPVRITISRRRDAVWFARLIGCCNMHAHGVA